MAPLPTFRHQSRLMTAFDVVGLDFAGPWYTNQGRAPDGKPLPRQPRYLLVIACTTFRAIHLEMTYAHTTEEVLQGLQRFASRRRIPSQIISDNAKELHKVAQTLSRCARQPVVSYPIDPGWGETQWTFTCPRAPNTNGATEAMVGVAKRAIKRAMPKYDLTDSLLHTVFTYCEDIANRRPLVRNFSDPHDPEVLTPGHFIGAARGPLPETENHGPKNKYTVKWIQVANIRDEFYQRFQREMIPELQKQAKWWNLRQEPKIGDLVCVLEAKRTEYGHWPVGKILETYTGRDGIVRSALVKIKDTVLRRHLSHLIPLVEAQEQASELDGGEVTEDQTEDNGADREEMQTQKQRPLETARFEKPETQRQGPTETARFRERPKVISKVKSDNPYAKFYPREGTRDEQGRTPRELRLLRRNKEQQD